MDRMVKVEIAGQDRYLNYSMGVEFDVTDKFGSLKNMFEVLDKDDKESFEALRWIIVRLANDGELCRRMQGYDHGEILKDDDISMMMAPYDYTVLKHAVAVAARYGFQREIPDEKQKEIDLGLQELEEKKPEAGA